MTLTSRRLLLPAVLILLILLTIGLSANRLSDTASPPKAPFVQHACPFPVATGPFKDGGVRCGFLQVPENRNVANGRTIKLAVAVFTTRAAHAASDPFIYLAGGPGGPIVKSMGAAVARGGIPSFVGNRDLILIDQRGTGLSQPSLACPESDAVGRGATKKPLPQLRLFTLNHQAIQRCRARLVASGIDLSAYNTLENAVDIADLWTTLGYNQVNVYGGSYGARLALQVMRDHPGGIRSVVVDAVADPTFNQYTDETPNAWRAIQLVLAQCAASPACDSMYPHLPTVFTRTLTRLQAHPAAGQELVPRWGRNYPVRINGAHFAATLMAALYNPDLIPVVPGLIWDAAHKRYTQLFSVDAAVSAGSADSSLGMYLSAECADDQAGTSRGKIAASASDIPSSIRSDVITSVVDSLTLCGIWNVKSVPASNRQLFSSAIPTLLLEGSFDPRTPPARAQAVARKLSHGYYLEFHWLGHGVVGHGPCSDSIVSSFLEHPERKPNAGCIAQTPRVFG